LLLGLGQLRRIPEGKTAETSTRAARVITGDTYDIRSKDILEKLIYIYIYLVIVGLIRHRVKRCENNK
jgi:hypothetical protein